MRDAERSATSTLASAVPRVSWKCSASRLERHGGRHGVEDPSHLAGVRDANRVAQHDLVDAEIASSRRPARATRAGSTAPSYGQPKQVDR